MRSLLRTLRRRDGASAGQILILFALAITAMMIALALLFDGAQTLLLRRQLQNAGDAAALAAANQFQTTQDGCSGSLTTTARDSVQTKIRNSVIANLGWSSTKASSNVVITCPTGYNNYAVQVVLNDTSATFFGRIAGVSNIAVSTTSVAFNGPVGQGKFSVMQLDPGPPTTSGWASGYNGCPSVQFAGSAQLAFGGSVQVDSACLAANGGAFGVNGNASTICFGSLNFSTNVCTANGSTLRMVGTWTQGPNVVTPAPFTNQPYVQDPMSLAYPSTTGWLTCPSTDSRCPSNGGSKTTIGNGVNAQCAVLYPGIYNGGIEIKAQGSAYLLPGIYIMNGGGIAFTGQGSIYSIKNNVAGNCTSWTPEGGTPAGSTWSSTYCPLATTNTDVNACGVLIINQCSATTVTAANCGLSGTGSAPAPYGSIGLTGGAAFRLRAFCTANLPTGTSPKCGDSTSPSSYSFAPSYQQTSVNNITQYRNVVVWQQKSPDPTSSYHQPQITLQGGGAAYEAGTIYAPSGQVNLGGNCSGSGGTAIDLTLQFISWDLYITGSCGYNFIYNVNSFATFPAYGLIK